MFGKICGCLIGVVCLSLSGCATVFYGSAKVPNGPDGCKAQCAQRGMDMAGMVVMGEYSDGCICEAPGKKVSAAGAGAAAVQAIAGVVGQNRGMVTPPGH